MQTSEMYYHFIYRLLLSLNVFFSCTEVALIAFCGKTILYYKGRKKT